MTEGDNVEAVCEKCGATYPRSQSGPCPACGGTARHFVKPLAAELSFKGNRPGIAMEGDPHNPEGRRVESRPSSGGSSTSVTDKQGSFEASLDKGVEAGHAGENSALGVFMEALTRQGRQVRQLPGAEDQRGEDALLMIDGQRRVVQLVTLPVDQAFWKSLYQRAVAVLKGSKSDAVALVRAAFLHKKNRAKGTILVLDAAHVGVLASPRLVEEYEGVHGDPVKELSLYQAWIVGATARSAFQFGAGSSQPSP